MIDFKNINYLKKGTARQQLAYVELKQLDVFNKLSAFNPILVGTIPIDIALPESDLDITCTCENHTLFTDLLIKLFRNQNEFEVKTIFYSGVKSTIASFRMQYFEIEIFAQNIPSEEQNGYKHMIVEYKILKEKDKSFKAEILALKRRGLKTEPAFAKLLGLDGNPYEALLKI